MKQYLHFAIIVIIIVMLFSSYQSKYEVYAARKPPPPPSITLHPTSGDVGSKMIVYGANFKKNDIATITYDGVVVGSVSTGTGKLGGTFSKIITVPSSVAGAHIIRATDTHGSIATATFTVVASASMDPTTGEVGSIVTVSGNGTAGSSTITIKYDGSTVTTTPSNSTGSFSTTFTVPASVVGSHTVQASDGTNSGSGIFTVVPAITINPIIGVSGSSVTVSGTGYASSSVVTIKFNGTIVSTTPATITTDSIGSFSATFTIPAAAAGVYTVQATDASSNTESETFTVIIIPSPDITIFPSTGAVHSTATVSGVAYTGTSTVTVKFDGATVTTTPSTITTDPAGSFSATFTIPKSISGVHTIQATDTSNKTSSETFTVVPSVTMSQSIGEVGSIVTVSGTGYIGTSTVTVKFDGSSVATTTSDSTGSFSTTFTVPSSVNGVHTVQSTDGTNSYSIGFTVISLIETDTDNGIVGSTVTVSGTGYTGASIITIKFNATTVPTIPSTITTDTAGSFSATFTVPTSTDNGTYIISATDTSGKFDDKLFTAIPLEIVASGGSTYGGPPPSFNTGFLPNEYPLSIDGKNYKLPLFSNSIPTAIFETGKPIKLSLLSFSNRGPDTIQHIALYTNLHGLNSDIYQSDTYIIYEKGEAAQIVDPHNFFANANINTEPAGNKLKVEFDITFAKPMDKSHIILRTWNINRNSMDTKILDALQVVQSTSTIKSIQTMTSNASIEKIQAKSGILHIMIKPEMQKLNMEKLIQEESAKIAKDKAKADAFIKASQSKLKMMDSKD